MIVGKNSQLPTYKKAIYIHAVFACVFFIALLLSLKSATVPLWVAYSSLAFVCSGVAISGLIFRSKLQLYVKLYFGVFAATFFLFVSSPSTLFSLITKGKLKVENYDRFHITDNYYLDKQSSFIGEKDAIVQYKIVQKLGYFNKTISRNIDFKNDLDSIKTISFEVSKSALLRGYFHLQNTVDSTDVSIDLKVIPKKNEITTKLKS
jgi:hypothetical protein